jgi:hypothetical protein
LAPAGDGVKVVEVEWIDSTSWSGWKDTNDARRDSVEDSMLHRTVGYLLADEPSRVVLCFSATAAEDVVSDVQAIPRFAVKKMRTLRK